MTRHDYMASMRDDVTQLRELLAMHQQELTRLRALWLRASPLLQLLGQHESATAKTRQEANAILLEFHQPPEEPHND